MHPVRITLYVQRLSDRPGFVAQAERDEPWWHADADGYGDTPEAAAAAALAAMPAIPEPDREAVEIDA
jgi:hypothetical protein